MCDVGNEQFAGDTCGEGIDQPFTVTCWEDRQEVSFTTYPTEREARAAARQWAGPKQDRAYAQFAQARAYYSQKHPKGLGRKALVDGPKYPETLQSLGRVLTFHGVHAARGSTPT